MHAVTRDGVRNSLQRIRLAIIWVVLVTSAASGQGISASNNTINGVVRVFDLDGDELEDRSGVVVFVDGLSDSASYRPQTGQSSPWNLHTALTCRAILLISPTLKDSGCDPSIRFSQVLPEYDTDTILTTIILP